MPRGKPEAKDEMREKFISDLVKEVLGPRAGMREVIQESDEGSPLNEYITGVLAPASSQAAPEIDDEAAIPVEDVQDLDEETSDVDVDVRPFFSPALDPKRRSPTMGISFIVQSADRPRADVCLTWARYRRTQERQGAEWHRDPRHRILSVNLDSNQRVWLDGSGMETDPLSAEVSFHVMVRQDQKGVGFVSLYLVNRLRVTREQTLTAEHHIFQPQIRVVCHDGTSVLPCVPTGERSVGGDEESMLEFLYGNRPVYARGHLCSAIWRDIDPEKAPPSDIKPALQEYRGSQPFAWPDGELLQPHDRQRFSPPDLRSEFVPIYSITAPDLEWREEHGRKPELRAGELAEMWDPSRLRDALSPLADGYEKWIDSLQSSISLLPARHIPAADRSLSECREVLARIKSGIDILCSDPEARLAFCFANRAIDQQSRWSPRGEGLTWYPFQLAFFLMSIEPLVRRESSLRSVCDLLWVPTGTGKTEAYLAAVAFAIAYRRRHARKGIGPDRTGAGVAVITRYTLRLLTIQQFRRTLGVIVACERLRIHELTGWKRIGWRPAACPNKDNFLWGSTPFSVGLWVGGNVRPNFLTTIIRKGMRPVFGAIDILRGKETNQEGEPAQVLNCPACMTVLAVPEMGLQAGQHELHFVVHAEGGGGPARAIQALAGRKIQNVQVMDLATTEHRSSGFYTITIKAKSSDILKAHDVDALWENIDVHLKASGIAVALVPARASRMGYFLRTYVKESGNKCEYDFEVFCPNPACPLHEEWVGGAPLGWIHGTEPTPHVSATAIPVAFPDGNKPVTVNEAFRVKGPCVSDRIPIPALIVDQQVYQRLPTVVVATVDKFARVPFEPRAAALFGNVDHYHCVWGYYREHEHLSGGGAHPSPLGSRDTRNYQEVRPVEPPQLILQDELHLIEGPLGSLVGFYETAVDYLCNPKGDCPVKYVASTATVRRAEEQIGAVFARKLQLFPPHGLSSSDRFFIKEDEVHPIADESPGRLYVGICAPGRGPLTPIVRVWSRLLQTAWENSRNPDVDSFWTLTGYFNAVRELGGSRALYGQDIPQRIRHIAPEDPRRIPDEKGLELSSRTSSTDLPAILDILGKKYPSSPDALFTTSMFGAGVDIQRLGLMVVNGQPKTTSSYIQSTGRVGRSRGGLVVTFLRATRPRDLSHYEYFCGYHRQLHRFVEPVTVYPFAPGVLDRAMGSVGVFILRSMRGTSVEWHLDESAVSMATRRTSAPELATLPVLFAERAARQPLGRRPSRAEIQRRGESELDRWWAIAGIHPNLKYMEYRNPQNPVVLGDSEHVHAHLAVVYKSVPQSLRDVEETTGIQTR